MFFIPWYLVIFYFFSLQAKKQKSCCSQFSECRTIFVSRYTAVVPPGVVYGDGDVVHGYMMAW